MDIEKNRFTLQNRLKTEKGILQNLKRIKTRTPEKQNSDILLNFDIGNKSQYLPISRQIEAAESSLVNLEETIKYDEQRLNTFKICMPLTVNF